MAADNVFSGFPVVVPNVDVGVAVASLGGTLTGTTDGDLADIADIALDTSNTYTDAAVNTAVNTAIAAANLQIKELQTTVNALLASLRTAKIIAE